MIITKGLVYTSYEILHKGGRNNNYDFMCIQNIKDINNYKNELERHFSYKSQFEL